MFEGIAVLRYEFELGKHKFRAFWLPEQREWLLVNSTGQFSFGGSENMGLGRVKAMLKKLIVNRYNYLLANAHRVIVRIGQSEGYLSAFRFSEQKAWARNVALA